MYSVWARFGCHLMTPPRSMFQWQIAPNHWQIMGVKPIQIPWTLLDISTIGCIPELRGSCLCLQQQMRGEANRVANLPTCPCQYSAAYLGDFSSLIDSRTNFEWSGMKRVKTTMTTTMTMTLLTPPPASRVGESISQMTQPHTAPLMSIWIDSCTVPPRNPCKNLFKEGILAPDNSKEEKNPAGKIQLLWSSNNI